MPKFNVRPLIKLSKQQYKVLAERVIQKEGEISRGAVDEIMQYAPPAEKTMGNLTTKSTERGMETFERLPIAEARAKYYSNPDLFTPGRAGPPARVVRPSVPGEPAEIGRGVSYELEKTATVDTPKARIDHLMTTPIAEITSDSAHADRLWAMLGGGRSVGGKLWERYRASSRQKASIDTAKDYFNSCFVRWKAQPKDFAKKHPREAKILNRIWDEYAVGMPDGSVK